MCRESVPSIIREVPGTIDTQQLQLHPPRPRAAGKEGAGRQSPLRARRACSQLPIVGWDPTCSQATAGTLQSAPLHSHRQP